MKKIDLLSKLQNGEISTEQALIELKSCTDIKENELIFLEDTKDHKKPRWIRVRVATEEGSKVNIRVPLFVAKSVVFFKKNKELKDIDMKEVFRFIKENGKGIIVDIKANETHVEIIAE